MLLVGDRRATAGHQGQGGEAETHQGGDPHPRRGAGCAGEGDLAHVAQPLDDRLERRTRGHEGERPGVFAAMAPCEAISFMSPVLRLFTTTR